MLLLRVIFDGFQLLNERHFEGAILLRRLYYSSTRHSYITLWKNKMLIDLICLIMSQFIIIINLLSIVAKKFSNKGHLLGQQGEEILQLVLINMCVAAVYRFGLSTC